MATYVKSIGLADGLSKESKRLGDVSKYTRREWSMYKILKVYSASVTLKWNLRLSFTKYSMA